MADRQRGFVMSLIVSITLWLVGAVYVAGGIVMLSECRRAFPTWPYLNPLYQIITWLPVRLMNWADRLFFPALGRP